MPIDPGMAFSLSNLRREFDWHVKRALPWSGPKRKKTMRGVGEVLATFSGSQLQRYTELASAYDLSPWPRVCTAREYRYNLYYLDVGDRYLRGSEAVGGLRIGGRALDVGARNWYYAPALHALSAGSWLGVEIDGHERYANLMTRRAHGEMMCSPYPLSRYAVQSVVDLDSNFDLITWFLPYVTTSPLIHAGLPDRFFAPERLLSHVWSILRPGGALFVINPDREEEGLQQCLFERLSIEAKPTGPMETEFPTDEGGHCFGFVARKSG